MTCDQIRPLLSGYHDDALSIEQRARVRAHLAECAGCRSALAAYDRLYASLRELTAPVPVDLRRNVYARIAAIESHRRFGARVGPGLLRTLRTASGTAGLLAVLGALALAASRLGTGLPPHPPSTDGGVQAAAASRAMDAMIDAVHRGTTAQLPTDEQSVVSRLRLALSVSGMFTITGKRNKADGSIAGQLVEIGRSGAPSGTVPMSLTMGSRGLTPVVKSARVGTPTPLPTIPADEGLAYLHLDNPNALLGHGNSPAEVEWHSFASSSRPRVLVTPEPSGHRQLFTGLTADADDGSIVYAAMGTGPYGGIFAIDARTGAVTPVVRVPDVAPPNSGYAHMYVRQVYASRNGLLFTRVEQSSAVAVTMSVNLASGQGSRVVKRIPPIWSAFVVSPDRRRIAWTHRARGMDGIGVLQVANLVGRPMTQTIGLGAHPVWSPDSARILYKSADAQRLYVWSPGTGSRELVALDRAIHGTIDVFTWAPNGRYFAYVVRTAGANGASRVWLGDRQTGYTWHVFDRRWIGSIAWAREPATQAAPSADAWPTVEPVASVTPAAGAITTPTPFADTSTPVKVLQSYYNAINRHELRRAFGYISTADPNRNFASFAKGYAETLADTGVRFEPARYVNGSNVHGLTCVGFELTAHNRGGHQTRYGGYYVVQSTTGQSPRNGGWRIMMSLTRSTRGGHLYVPRQGGCTPMRPVGTKSRTTAGAQMP